MRGLRLSWTTLIATLVLGNQSNDEDVPERPNLPSNVEGCKKCDALVRKEKVRFTNKKTLWLNHVRPTPSFEDLADEMENMKELLCPSDELTYRQSGILAVSGAVSKYHNKSMAACYNPVLHDFRLVHGRAYLYWGRVITDLKALPALVQGQKDERQRHRLPHVEDDVDKIIKSQKILRNAVVLPWGEFQMDHMAHWFQRMSWAWSFMHWLSDIAARKNLTMVLPSRPHSWTEDSAREVIFLLKAPTALDNMTSFGLETAGPGEPKCPQSQERNLDVDSLHGKGTR